MKLVTALVAQTGYMLLSLTLYVVHIEKHHKKKPDPQTLIIFPIPVFLLHKNWYRTQYLYENSTLSIFSSALKFFLQPHGWFNWQCNIPWQYYRYTKLIIAREVFAFLQFTLESITFSFNKKPQKTLKFVK